MSIAINSLRTMQSTIKNCIVSRIKIETDKKKACQGIYRGGSVTIGNRSYRAVPVVDIYFQNGDTVWCLTNDSTASAIIVGV